MADASGGDLRARVLEYLQKVAKAKPREIADALHEPKPQVDTVVKELAKEGTVEFVYYGTSYVKLADK